MLMPRQVVALGALVCLAVEALLALAQRVLTPAPIREFARSTTR